MNIAIDIRALLEGKQSGVYHYTTQLIHYLVTVAPQHTYHLFYNAYKPVQLPPLPPQVHVHAFRYPNKVFNVSQRAFGWPRWDKLLARRLPADESIDCFFLPSLLLLPLSRPYPLVLTMHDLSFERLPHLFNLRRRIWHWFVQPAQLAKRASHIIAVSRATARDVALLYGIPAAAITVAYSGANIDSRQLSRTVQHKVRMKYNLTQPFILSVGTIEPRKNIVGLVEAFQSIAADIPHHLVVAGSPGWLTKPLYQAIADSPVRHRIHCLGFIPEQHKSALFAAADLFVYPSFYEGFGFPPLEALLAGTPVVTSYNSSLPEIVGEWATLVNPHDTIELALAMRETLLQPARVPAEVPVKIRQRFDWRETARQTVAVIEQAAAA